MSECGVDEQVSEFETEDGRKEWSGMREWIGGGGGEPVGWLVLGWSLRRCRSPIPCSGPGEFLELGMFSFSTVEVLGVLPFGSVPVASPQRHTM